MRCYAHRQAGTFSLIEGPGRLAPYEGDHIDFCNRRESSIFFGPVDCSDGQCQPLSCYVGIF